MFGQEGGCNKTFFFINLCFAKCEKLSFFLGALFWQILVDVQKHYKIGISAHFSKQKMAIKWPFLNVTNWAKLNVTNWAKLVSKKKPTWPS